jgi:hypothetical protein
MALQDILVLPDRDIPTWENRRKKIIEEGI